jgi:flagellar basal body-associated protein FliL
MATDTDKTTKAPAAEAGKPAEGGGAKKKRLGVLAALAVAGACGALAAVVALPHKEPPKPVLEGPFVAHLSKENLQVNLAGENGKRYLVLSLNAEYFAYSETYVTARLGGGKDGGHGGEAAEDPLYTAMLKDTLLRMAARKTREQVEDPVQMEAFLMELRAAVEPLLFPVCVGDAMGPQQADSKSGLRAGESVMESTLRGLLHDHALHVDAVRRTIRLDEGPAASFRGDERDLRVTGADGEFVHVNVAGLDPAFVGEVPVGAAGRVRRIYRDQVLVQ